MNKYDIVNFKLYFTNKYSSFLDNRLLFTGKSNIEDIEIDYDLFLNISKHIAGEGGPNES